MLSSVRDYSRNHFNMVRECKDGGKIEVICKVQLIKHLGMKVANTIIF